MRKEYDLFWMRLAMEQFLSYYQNNVVQNISELASEMDYDILFWSVLDRCFQMLRTCITRDRSCAATSLRVNENRDDERPVVRAAYEVEFNAGVTKKLRIVCFHHTGRRMKLSLMDSPAGYICRLMDTDELKIPFNKRLNSCKHLPNAETDNSSQVKDVVQILEGYKAKTGTEADFKAKRKFKEAKTIIPPALTTHAPAVLHYSFDTQIQ
ncbi:hypothetical protein BDB00DRAFT_939557 [Zychaea mexicana]|uniref:uncharacterized protein n=1 Tax=Zychaea mexicana TaxID=64656 RepID=UPI0022FEBB50|nr:uncharacterized protein BDB00DRAFT_939557 [Zychaea mexicana]KAI9492657.1 hypothetical protein BDB00DRAFT_939557 [Zychaea mexicana]